MKNLKNIDETIHSFFNHTHESGKSGNVYFENNTLFSYGSHFELAKFIEFEGKQYLFINTSSYSNTTSKHQSKVRSYINKSLVEKVFYFDFRNNSSYYYSSYSFHLDKTNLIETINRLINSSKDCFNSQLRARENTWNYSHGMQFLNTAKSLNDIFYSLIGTDEIILISNLFYEIETLRNEAEQKSILINETRGEREKLKQIKQLERNKERLEQWLKGENIRDLYNLPIHLSLKDRIIETTKGAKITLNEGLNLLNKIKNNENVHGLKVGSYTVNGFNNDILHVGCHKISMEQINLFEKTYLNR